MNADTMQEIESSIVVGSLADFVEDPVGVATPVPREVGVPSQAPSTPASASRRSTRVAALRPRVVPDIPSDESEDTDSSSSAAPRRRLREETVPRSYPVLSIDSSEFCCLVSFRFG
jgi:hypothetical protein